MFHIYNIFLLSLFFIYSISIDIDKHYSNRTIASSRSVYDLFQIRRAAARFAAYRNKTHRNNFNQSDENFENNHATDTPRMKISKVKNHQNRFSSESLIASIIIISIVMVFTIISVIICILARYYQHKYLTSPERVEQRPPLNSSRQTNRTTKYVEMNYDRRNFSRKPRTLPTAV